MLSCENIASSFPYFSVLTNKVERLRLMKLTITGAVLIASGHIESFNSRLLRNPVVLGELQVRTWWWCSSSWLHNGHSDNSLSFLFTITLPVTVSSLSHYVIEMLVDSVTYLRAVPNGLHYTFIFEKSSGTSGLRPRAVTKLFLATCLYNEIWRLEVTNTPRYLKYTKHSPRL